MSTENTTENNKLLAEFMNVIFDDDKNQYYDSKEGIFIGLTLKYHSDWNWLIEVVENIESVLPDDSIITIEYKNCFIPVLDDEEPFTIEGCGETKLIAVYNACIEFVKWYNSKPELHK